MDQFPPLLALFVESVQDPVACIPGKIVEEALPARVAMKSRPGRFSFADKVF